VSVFEEKCVRRSMGGSFDLSVSKFDLIYFRVFSEVKTTREMSCQKPVQSLHVSINNNHFTHALVYIYVYPSLLCTYPSIIIVSCIASLTPSPLLANQTALPGRSGDISACRKCRSPVATTSPRFPPR